MSDGPSTEALGQQQPAAWPPCRRVPSEAVGMRPKANRWLQTLTNAQVCCRPSGPQELPDSEPAALPCADAGGGKETARNTAHAGSQLPTKKF